MAKIKRTAEGQNACVAKVTAIIHGSTFSITSQRDGIHIHERYSREPERIVTHAELVKQAHTTKLTKPAAIEIDVVRDDLAYAVFALEAGLELDEAAKADIRAQLKKAAKLIA